eukprot:gene20436-23212_t
MKSASVKPSSSSFGVVPPSNFSYIEENICRCTFPISRHNLSFIQSTSLNYIINISGRKHDQAVLTYFEEKNIEVKALLQDGESPPFTPLSSLETWIASTIEIILAKSSECSVLIVGGVDSFYDCLVIACLRRLQEWSYVSILAEFRQFTWPQKLFDFEQVIEKFDVGLIEIPSKIPEFLSIHDNFKEEEHKLLHKLKLSSPTTQVAPKLPLLENAEGTGEEQLNNHPVEADTALAAADYESSDAPTTAAQSIESNQPATDTNSVIEPESTNVADGAGDTCDIVVSATEAPKSNEQDRIDAILQKLFFSPKNQLISEGTVYDPSISLINEKDEED